MPKTKQGMLTVRFGVNLSRVLHDMGAKTYREKAELLRTTVSDVHNMCNAGHSPTLDKIEDTAKRLGVDVEVLLAPIETEAAVG